MSKKVTKVVCSMIVLSFLVCSNSLAFSRSFVFDFSHYLPSKVYKGNEKTIKINVDVSVWGSDSFYIKQVSNSLFSKKTYATKYIKKSSGNKQTVTFSNNGSCQYQFWKKDDKKRIQGTGTIKW